MMDTIPDLIFVKNKDYKIVQANNAFFNIYPPNKRNKVIGYTCVENFSDEESKLFLEQDRIAFENGFSQVYEDIKIFNGKILNIFTTKVKFYDDDNNEYILAIGRDISDLIEVQKNLERKIEERTHKYKVQKNIAEEAARIKEQFLANMSHELRTPLNSIIGLTKILIDEGNFKADEKESLSIINSASDSLLRTVNDILDISKIESGKMSIENKSFNMSDFLNDIIEQIKPLANKKGLSIKDNIEELGDVYVNSDSHKISKIIVNLLGNAVRYTDEGHIKIKIQLDDKENEYTDFTIIVSDTGIGISQEKQEVIFDEFSQGEGSEERGGTGLGLCITKKLIDLMKGFITVDSKVGFGSTFTVKLPLMKSSQEESNKNNENKFLLLDQKEKMHISKAKIYIAEDHELNKILIQKILKRIGNDNFLIFSNGIEILQSFKKSRCDLILMDCHMPQMDGYEAASKIRKFENDSKEEYLTPIISMTADIMPGTKDKCLDAGMSDYLSKPIDELLLKEKLQKWFNLYNYEEAKLENDLDDKKDINTSINLSLLDSYTNNNKDKKEMVDVFYNKSLQDLGVLKSNCLDGINLVWVETSRSLKDSSEYIGAGSLKNMCIIGQAMLDSTEEERLSIYKKIKEEHERICNALVFEGFLDRREA